MRVLRTDNFGNYVAYDQEPAWMQAEHYDFCDEFVESKYNRKHSRFISLLVSAIEAIL